MTFFSDLLAYIKGDIATLEAKATAFEQAMIPGVEATAKQMVTVFADEAAPIAEQLGTALISGILSGGNPSVLIPQLVNDGIKDLEPAAVVDGKNALYTVANLALANALGNGTISLPVPAATAPVSAEAIPAVAEVATANIAAAQGSIIDTAANPGEQASS